MGLVTAGLGKNLVTVGLGLVTVIIVTVPQSQGGAGVYHKKRKKGIYIKNSSNTIILQTLTVKSEIPLKMLKMLKMNNEEESTILKKIHKILENQTGIGVTVLSKSIGPVKIKQHFIRLLEGKTSIQGEKFLNFLEKQVEIVENKMNLSDKKTKHINPVDVLSDIEMTEVLDIIKNLDEVEDV